MASATDSTNNEASDPQLRWSGRWTLTHRILALNILTLLLVGLRRSISMSFGTG
jgi:two-component system sensor histidine kinase ChvG